MGQGSASGAESAAPAADPRNLIRFVPAKGVQHATSVPHRPEVSLSIDPRWVVIVADGDSDAAALRRAMTASSGGDRTSAAALASVRHRFPSVCRRSQSSGADRAGRPLVIGADHGALRAEALGLTPDLVVGDADSLHPPSWLTSAPVVFACSWPRATRTKATRNSASTPPSRPAPGTSVSSARWGGHAPSTAWPTCCCWPCRHSTASMRPSSPPRRPSAASARSDGPGRLELEGTAGDHVSLFALDSVVVGVRTRGLRFPLRDEPLHARAGPRPFQRARLTSQPPSRPCVDGCSSSIPSAARRCPHEPTSGSRPRSPVPGRQPRDAGHRPDARCADTRPITRRTSATDAATALEPHRGDPPGHRLIRPLRRRHGIVPGPARGAHPGASRGRRGRHGQPGHPEQGSPSCRCALRRRQHLPVARPRRRHL